VFELMDILAEPLLSTPEESPKIWAPRETWRLQSGLRTRSETEGSPTSSPLKVSRESNSDSSCLVQEQPASCEQFA